MGLNVVNGQMTPKLAYFPIWNPEELKAQGEDLATVHSCAIPKEGEIKGCMYARRCSRLFGQKGTRIAERIGDFGPQSLTPGTPGQGPEIVPYSIETADGFEKEDHTICHIFMASIYPRMIASHNPDPEFRSDERIRILGKAGMDIFVKDLVPEDPKACNKNGNYTMVATEGVQRVPKYREWMKLPARVKARMLGRKADAEEAIESLLGETAAAEDEALAAVAEESTPVRRKRGTQAQAEGG
jgi:hypothetical protein